VAKTALPGLGEIVNVSTIPQLSPFRYPGGKTWLIPQIRRWLGSILPRAKLLVEPFAGGGIVGLTAAFEGLCERVLLVELDEDVAAVWEAILGGKAEVLARRILSFDLTTSRAKEVLSAVHEKLEDRAFATLLRNRVQHGGIICAGAALMKEGENGRGISSRWYPQTLANRIAAIERHRDRIAFQRGDALAAIRRHADDPAAVFFVDPPYTLAGKRLYRHCEIDHSGLFDTMARVKGDFLMTYDDTPEVRGWAKGQRLDIEPVAMKSRQHARKSELLIGRSLGWARG
jgi:DNA adenine methylase